MKKIGILIFVTTLLSSCATTKQNSYRKVDTVNAIILSAKKAPNAVRGIFEVTIKSADCDSRMEFLHSQEDKLDQRNLIIALRPNAVQELTQLHGQKPEEFFIGKRIQVTGEAKRVKNWVKYKNKNIGQFFYQTKVFVKSADQVLVL